MKYSYKNINKVKENIEKDIFIDICKNESNHFIRKRKIGPKEIVLYELNKKGLTSKMEILNFNNVTNVKNISSPGLFKQREKLNPAAFTYLIQDSLREFYINYKDEVKTYKGYVLIGVDGSDFEIPNSKISREKYNGKMKNQCARVTVSTCYDLLNHYTLDTIVEKYNYSETKMAEEHYKTIKEENLVGEFKTIRITDRNYRNLSHIYHNVKDDNKFLTRIAASVYEKENQKMETDDEIIELGYEPNRVNYYKKTDPELYEYLKSGNVIKVRCVKVPLDTGEIEYLLTNLEKELITKEEIKELYTSRWQIETNYRHLKNNLKIECITSSKEILIKQDIFSQVLVSNMLQAFINDNDEIINQKNYKNKMKTNSNMSVGIFKNTLIYILLEKDSLKRSKMMDKFCELLEKYVIPIKLGRKNERNNNPKNKHHINQRKSF